MLADLDSFFVAVERIYRPELIGLPVVVGGPPDGRGVIAACSYEARALGMHSGMAMNQARSLAEAALAAVRMQDERAAHGGSRDFEAWSNWAGEAEHVRPGAPSVPAAQMAALARPYLQRIRELGLSIGGIVGPVVFLHGPWLHGGYSEHSRKVQGILRESVPDFITRSIDEFELDISGCADYLAYKYGGILPFASHLRQRVWQEQHLRLSIGLGPNRILAKMASKQAKPHKAAPGSAPEPGQRGSGIMLVQPQDALDFLTPLPVQEVPGIGPATTQILQRDGLMTIGDLLAKPRSVLLRLYHKPVAGLVEALCDNTGGQRGPVLPAISKRLRPKSIGHQSTFSSDQRDSRIFAEKLWHLTEAACRRLREAELCARHLTVTVRYSDFTTLSHGSWLAEPGDNERQLFPEVLRLFHEAKKRPDRIRLLGVRFEQLAPGGSQELLFGAPERGRERRFFGALDLLRERYGDECLRFGPAVFALNRPQERPGLAAGGQPSSFMEGSPMTQQLQDARRDKRAWLAERGILPGGKQAERALGKYPGQVDRGL